MSPSARCQTVPKKQVEVGRGAGKRGVMPTWAALAVDAPWAKPNDPFVAVSVVRMARTCRCSAVTFALGVGAKLITSSSIPSEANLASNRVIGPTPASESARWMAVSCAWRRTQKVSGDGRARRSST